jgi:uncharacterized protein HemY
VPSIAVVFWLLLGAWSAADAAGAADATPDRPSRARPLLTGLALAALVGGFGVWTLWNRAQAAYMECCLSMAHGQWAPAAADLERARALDPGQRAYTLVRAEMALAAGRRDVAETTLDGLAASRTPLDPAYRLMLAWLQAERGDLSAARATADHVCRVDDPAQYLARIDSGLLAERAGDAAAADAWYREAAAMNSEAMGGYAGLARLAWARGDAAEARSWLAKGASVGMPRDRMAPFLLGYGRIHPTAMMPPAERGRWPEWRPHWDGTVTDVLVFNLDAAALGAPAP